MTHTPPPALATLTHEPFWAEGWVYERKLDGQRCLASRESGRVRLRSRTGRDVSAAFPELVDALGSCTDRDFLVDGEVVAFDGPRTSFSRLQPRIQVADADRARRSDVPVHLYLFDVLRDGDDDVRDEPLLARKRRLRGLVDFDAPLHYTPHRRTADEAYLRRCCRRGWEGLIAKQEDAAYPSGRSRSWLKFKCEARQELVVVGWTDPEGSRPALGALLLAHYRGPDLVYAGKVGTGFSEEELRDLRRRLGEHEVAESPCARGRLPTRGVHWSAPRLVAELAFTEWTSAGQLRHPRYLGLRPDKRPEEVTRE